MMRTIIGTAARGDTEMIQYLADLLELLQLEPLEHDLFRGLSHTLGTRRIFGGPMRSPSCWQRW